MRNIFGVRGRGRRRFWKMVEGVCLCVLIGIVITIGLKLYRSQEVRREEERAAETVRNMNQTAEIPDDLWNKAVQDYARQLGNPPKTVSPATPVPEGFFGDPSKLQTPRPTPCVVVAEATPAPDFDALLEENPDTVGVITFGERSMYICQGEDNQYYANHRFDGTEDPAGMIYMDFRCPVEPLGENTILYGHNMKDGSRFGSLKEFVDTEMLLKYPVFQLTTLYANHRFVPIAIFYTTVEEEGDQYFDFAQCEFADQWAFERYIISIKARSEVEIPATAVYGDKLLTLATCSSVMDRGRLVVVCKELL